MERIAVVTGANKGIGFETCKQLASNGVFVVLTARDVERGNAAIAKLASIGISNVVFQQLDVVDSASIASLAEFIKTRYGRLDILVNNAAITGSKTTREGFVLTADYIKGPNAKALKAEGIVLQTYESAEYCLRTNYYGTKRVIAALLPLLQQSSSPRIVNVSSSLGQLQFIPGASIREEFNDIGLLTEEKVDGLVERFLKDLKEEVEDTKGWPVILSPYIVSKAALNAYTRVMAKKYPRITINAVNPGHTKTDLNHNTGPLTVEEGTEGPVHVALRPDDGTSGVFFDRTVISTF